MRPVCLLIIFLLFTLLYLIIKLKINLLSSIEKALLTLHVTTEAHFLLVKIQKHIIHGIVKMCVMG